MRAYPVRKAGVSCALIRDDDGFESRQFFLYFSNHGGALGRRDQNLRARIAQLIRGLGFLVGGVHRREYGARLRCAESGDLEFGRIGQEQADAVADPHARGEDGAGAGVREGVEFPETHVDIPVHQGDGVRAARARRLEQSVERVIGIFERGTEIGRKICAFTHRRRSSIRYEPSTFALPSSTVLAVSSRHFSVLGGMMRPALASR